RWQRAKELFQGRMLTSPNVYTFGAPPEAVIEGFRSNCNKLNRRGWAPKLPDDIDIPFWRQPLRPIPLPFCICHGDMTIDNVRVTQDDEVVLIDFAETRKTHFLRDVVTLEAHV